MAKRKHVTNILLMKGIQNRLKGKFHTSITRPSLTQFQLQRVQITVHSCRPEAKKLKGQHFLGYWDTFKNESPNDILSLQRKGNMMSNLISYTLSLGSLTFSSSSSKADNPVSETRFLMLK